jgi:TonB family protein
MQALNQEIRHDTLPATAFASLPVSYGPWKYVGFAFVGQLVVAVLVGRLTFSLMAPVIYPVDTNESVHLVAPDLSVLKPPPQPVEVAKVRPPVIIPKPKIEPPKVTPPPVETAKITPPPLPPAPKVERAPEPLAGPKLPQGSSAPVTLNKPPRQVQTGGFGDPNGVPANPNANSKGPHIAKVGTFDLPEGSGTGNGSGGNKGARGTVASAGFGNGVAAPGQEGSGRQGTVQATNFGSGQAAPGGAPKSKPTPTNNDTPVSLISKPTPAYTQEARQRKVEGEVRLEVEFTAAGQVRVLRIVQGLGYGLDEAAVRAAEQIRFAPARRDGQAVDSQGRLSIVFRLS